MPSFHAPIARHLLAASLLLASSQALQAEPKSDQQLQDIIRSLTLASPYRISPTARAGTIRYWLQVDGDATRELPETGEQHVVRDGNGWIVTICASGCGRETPPSQQDLERDRNATAWLQSDDAMIRMLARPAIGNVEQRMRALSAAVKLQLSLGIDYRGYLSARDAFDARRGDCTEFALLLAAAARARGIPARVVAGLAYSSHFSEQPHTFGPHMWVQVWDGARWVSHDAALGAFDAGRIALAIGDGSPDSLRGVPKFIQQLRIAQAAAVQTAATTEAPR